MEKSSRRNFLESSATAMAGGAILTGLASTETEAHGNDHKSIPFVHHVLFWLKNPRNKKESDQLLAGLKALGAIKEIKGAHIGSPSVNEFDKPVTDASYSFSVMLIFASKKDEEKYLVHPLHKKFIDDHKHLWSKVVVYDSIQIE